MQEFLLLLLRPRLSPIERLQEACNRNERGESCVIGLVLGTTIDRTLAILHTDRLEWRYGKGVQAPNWQNNVLFKNLNYVG